MTEVLFDSHVLKNLTVIFIQTFKNLYPSHSLAERRLAR